MRRRLRIAMAMTALIALTIAGPTATEPAAGHRADAELPSSEERPSQARPEAPTPTPSASTPTPKPKPTTARHDDTDPDNKATDHTNCDSPYPSQRGSECPPPEDHKNRLQETVICGLASVLAEDIPSALTGDADAATYISYDCAIRSISRTMKQFNLQNHIRYHQNNDNGVRTADRERQRCPDPARTATCAKAPSSPSPSKPRHPKSLPLIDELRRKYPDPTGEDHPLDFVRNKKHDLYSHLKEEN